MTNVIQTNTPSTNIKTGTLPGILRRITGFLSQPAPTSPDSRKNTFDHIPKHIRMDIALDELERARLLQGGLR